MLCAHTQTIQNIALTVTRISSVMRGTCRFRQAEANFSWNGVRQESLSRWRSRQRLPQTLQGSVRDARPRSQSGATFLHVRDAKTVRPTWSSPPIALGHWLTQDNHVSRRLLEPQTLPYDGASHPSSLHVRDRDHTLCLRSHDSHVNETRMHAARSHHRLNLSAQRSCTTTRD
jgi:hypothetical protein